MEDYQVGKIEYTSTLGLTPPLGWELSVGINNFEHSGLYALISNTGQLYAGTYDRTIGGFATSTGTLGTMFVHYYIKLPKV